MSQNLIIGAKTGGSSNLLRINDTSRRFSFRDVDGSWKEASNVDYVIFEKPDDGSSYLLLELSSSADYSSLATINSQTDQTNFIYYDGTSWAAFPAAGIASLPQGTLVAYNFASVLENIGNQVYFRFWWTDGTTETVKKASIFPAMSLASSGATQSIDAATDVSAGIARAATQTEVNNGTTGFIFVTPATLNAKTFEASKITGLATVATSGSYADLTDGYELPAASASVRGGIKIGSNINLTNTDVISVSSASASTAGVVQLASAAEVTAGTVNTKAVTPAGLKVELDKKANSADLADVATSGSYNDLTDKPTIPTVSAASTTQAGIVRLATTAEAAGSLETIAVTPAGLSSVLGSYYTSSEIDSKISAVFKFKGSKDAESELPSTDNSVGDVWIVTADSSEYVWNGTAWEKLGVTVSLDGYLTSEAAAQTYVAKTQLATSDSAGIVQIGQNINIDSGVISVRTASAITAGVVQLASTSEVTAGVNNFKAVTPAGLKFELDKKVNSADLAAVATSGDYNDLSNKYELPAATSTMIGGVKPGGNLTVTADGTLNFTGFGAQSSGGSSLSSEIKVLKAGSGTQFSYNSGVLTIGLDSSVTGGLTAVSHDSTLTGQGTSADPLKVNAVTSVAAEANASDDKIPTELAVRKAVDAQKVTKLVLQRGVSDKALYPKIAFSASADFSSASEFDFSSNDFARSSARVFNGTGWITFPADGLGTPFDNKEVVIDVATLLGDAMPQLPFYFKFCWVEANGTASDYKSSVFPAAPSFPPAADVVDEERLLPTGGARGNVLKIDSTGKATWAEGIDEARLVPTGGGAGKVLGFQDGADRGNSDNVKLLLQNALTDSATGNASPATVTAQGVTLTAENDLDFSGNDSHVTAVLPVAEIFAADKEWTIDFWFNPVANSSRWNYVLTENNGSWGSHSLGLTWNSTNQTLEQDSGGYVASTIKAPNWPNASTPCTSNQWHFVAVEKQKTENGWSLNYYLNGSPWLQVAFTSDFTPFDSTTPFWFGGNTSDGGRWFKGKANKLRVTAGARYGGKAFAVPDRSVDYEAPSGLPVWIDQVIPELVDESRLLPTGGRNGNLLEYQEGADRGNNVNTKLLLQPATSDGLIVDQAAGNAAPVGITNSGNVAIAANALVFSGENGLIIEPDTLGMTLGGNNEYSIEVDFQLDQVKSDWATLFGGDGSMTRSAFYINSSGATAVQGGIAPDTTGWTTGTRHRLTIERFQDGDSWKTVIYRNGAVLATSVTTPNTLSGDRFPIGSNLEGTGRNFVGKIWAFRISNKAEHRGVSFTPRELPFLPPAGQPVWTEGIDRSRLLPENPANGDIPCFDATATVGGGNDVNTKVLLHFDELQFADTAAGNASPAAVTNSGVTLDTENFKFGTASAKFANSSNNLKVAVPQAQMMASPWLADCWFKVDDGQWNEYCRIFTQDDEQNGGWNYYLMSGNRVGVWVRGITPNEPASQQLSATDWHYAALVYYNAKFYGFIDGVRFTVQDGSSEGFLNYIMLGKRIQSTSYSLRGNIDEFRFQLLDEVEIGKWTGTSIAVPDAPYSKPQTVGEWGKFNKAELVRSVNGVVPDELGNVDTPSIDESRLLPETRSVSSDSVGNPVIFKAISRIDNTYWLCLPLNEDTNDRSTYDVATGVYGTVNIVSNAPSSPGGSAFFNGSSCLHGTLPAQFGSGDFTVRFWMMAPGMNSSTFPQTIFSTRYGDQTDASTFALLCTTEGRLYIYSNGDITSRTDTPFTLQPSVWYHVAVVRKSGVLTIYVNGEVYNSATFTNSLTRQIFGLGASWASSSYSEAGTVYLTSLDVLNYAAYDGAFTTPAYQPGILAGMGYSVATDNELKGMLSVAGIDEQIDAKISAHNESVSAHPGVVRSVNGVQPDSSGNVTIETSSGGLTSVSVGNGLTGNGTSSNPVKLDLSNAVMEHNCDINAQVHNFSVSLLNEVGISATSVSLTLDSLELTTGPVNIFIQKDGLYIDANQIRLNRHAQNAAGGFAIVGEDGKLPASIIPVSSNRHPFTSADLSSNVLTITTTGNVTGVIDDSGKAWNFADEEVTYTESTVSVDLSGVLARKGIVTPAGTWKLMLYGA